MNTIPIAFAFDNNLCFPACICISSLLMNANENTFYDIFILHSEKANLDTTQLDTITSYYKNCNIQYRTVDNSFDNAFEIRGITTAAYYRLLIPELITEYNKIIYADVDIIFRMDLSELYNIDINNYYMAATLDLGLNLGEDGNKYINSRSDLTLGNYIQSGFIVMNSKAIREKQIVEQFKKVAHQKLKYQDQDTLNIVCRNHIYYLSLEYNMTDYSYYYAINEESKLSALFNRKIIEKAILTGNIHYNGHKPWIKYCVNFDIWWEYYRKSPFFNSKQYFDFYYNKLEELDKLPLLKRIKILIRYFIVGKK